MEWYSHISKDINRKYLCVNSRLTQIRMAILDLPADMQIMLLYVSMCMFVYQHFGSHEVQVWIEC